MHFRKLKVLICTLILLFTLCIKKDRVYSHPHVFITYWTTVKFSKTHLKGIIVHWRFDEMFSSTISMQFDKDRNKRISARENLLLKKGAFDNLKHYKYFTFLKINGRPFGVSYSKVKKFRAYLKGNKLIYTFYVPLNIKLKRKNQKLSVFYTDNTIYVSFAKRRKPIIFKGNPRVKARYKTVNYREIITFRK